MKKTKLLSLSLCVLSLFIVSCAQSPSGNTESGSVLSKIDFRNKEKNGTVFAGRSARLADDGSALTQKFEGVSRYSNYTFDGLTDDDVAAIIHFEDSAAGIKVVFNTPESYKNKVIYQLDMTLEDESGKWSTACSVDKSVLADAEGKVKDSFEFEYPLVHPDVSHKFWFQVYFENNLWGHWGYSVTPKHGKARVDALPADYVDSNYCKFEDGLVILNDVIPPEAMEINKEIYLKLCKDGNDKWGGANDKRFSLSKDLNYGQKMDGYIGDIPNIEDGGETINMSEFPYFFVGMNYSYKIKNFNNLTFSSPSLSSNMYENSFFKKAEAERKVSKTIVDNDDDGKTVTFTGEGYFDGLYEGDIAVVYNGETFVPAVYVYGLNVYILKVENGEYTVMTSKSISDYLEEGGSFNNVDNDKVYIKLKTDASEANLEKSVKTEIKVK